MTLWFVFALMTAAAIFAVLWPLGRHGRPQEDGSEAVVYKDQLAEIDRDVAAGLIGSSEAEAARVEISRRLLAAADNRRDPPLASSVSLRRSAAIMAINRLQPTDIASVVIFDQTVDVLVPFLRASRGRFRRRHVPCSLHRALCQGRLCAARLPKRGVATPKAELDLIDRRLKRAREDYEQWLKSEKLAF